MMASGQIIKNVSGRLEYAVGFQACRADFDTLHSSVHTGTGVLQVREPAAPRLVMGMTDIVSADRLLAAHIAHFCHSCNPEFLGCKI